MIVLQVRTKSTAIIPTRSNETLLWQVLKEYEFKLYNNKTVQDIPLPDKIENFYTLSDGQYIITDIKHTSKAIGYRGEI